MLISTDASAYSRQYPRRRVYHAKTPLICCGVNGFRQALPRDSYYMLGMLFHSSLDIETKKTDTNSLYENGTVQVRVCGVKIEYTGTNTSTTRKDKLLNLAPNMTNMYLFNKVLGHKLMSITDNSTKLVYVCCNFAY